MYCCVGEIAATKRASGIVWRCGAYVRMVAEYSCWSHSQFTHAPSDCSKIAGRRYVGEKKEDGHAQHHQWQTSAPCHDAGRSPGRVPDRIQRLRYSHHRRRIGWRNHDTTARYPTQRHILGAQRTHHSWAQPDLSADNPHHAPVSARQRHLPRVERLQLLQRRL